MEDITLAKYLMNVEANYKSFKNTREILQVVFVHVCITLNITCAVKEIIEH